MLEKALVSNTQSVNRGPVNSSPNVSASALPVEAVITGLKLTVRCASCVSSASLLAT